MKISNVVNLREEVVKGEIRGWIRLRGIFEGGWEADPNNVLSATYPIAEIKNLLDAVDEKLRGARRTGFFILMGGYGTGKSHILCLLYHLFKHPNLGRRWLREKGIDLALPENSTVLAFSLTDEPPSYLWEPIFKGLGRKDLLDKVKAFPGTQLLKDALKGKGVTVIIVDEVESWYSGVKDKVNNLNFLQVLSEVACEEDSKLLVFCSLYGEVKEILGRLDRVKPYRVNLTLSKDREKIILFRLISHVDKVAVSKIVKSYMGHYRVSEVEIPNRSLYEQRMVELYPFHPELIKLLLTRYSSSPNYQNTRGVLCLLASVLSKKCSDVDLILASDVDMEEPDLLSLDRLLVENAQRDAESIGDQLTRRLLNVILLYSFGREEVGASRGDIVLGVLRPGMNINDLDEALISLPNKAPHVWPHNGKYVIGLEANIATIVQNTALEHIKRGEIEHALAVVKEKLRRDRSHFIYHSDPEIADEIPDDDRIKIVISLKSLNEEELLKLYEGREYPNMLIIYTPRSEAGDLTKDNDLLVVAERIHLCNLYEKESSGENRRLIAQLKERDERNLENKLSESYGCWIKVTEFGPKKVSYRLVECQLKDILHIVRRSYDVETIKSEVLRYLEGKRGGVSIKEILYDFKITPGKPIILDDTLLKKAFNSLKEEGEIVISGETVWLKEYYKPSPKLEEPVERAEPEIIEVERPTPGELVERGRVIEVIKPVLRVETSDIPTLHSLSVELERRVPEDSRISGIKLKFKDMEFDSIREFLKFLQNFQIEGSLSKVGFELNIRRSMDKRGLMSLIDGLADKVALPKGSYVKAVIEGD